MAVLSTDVEKAVVGKGRLARRWGSFAIESAFERSIIARGEQRRRCGGGVYRSSVSIEMCVSLRVARVGLICCKWPTMARILFLEVTRCVVVTVDGASTSRR
jgi:hypothetical protein